MQNILLQKFLIFCIYFLFAMECLISQWKAPDRAYEWLPGKREFLERKFLDVQDRGSDMLVISNEGAVGASTHLFKARLSEKAQKKLELFATSKLIPVAFFLRTEDEEVISLTTLKPRLQGL